MGFRRWCYVESKRFDLLVEGISKGLRISESSRGITRFIALNGKDSCWLLGTLDELLVAKDSAVFWRRSRAGFPSSYAQRCANKNGRFLMVENYGEGGRRSFILVPEGRNGEGWKSFRSELSYAVKIMGVGKGGDRPPATLSTKPSSTGKPPEHPRRRSYAETVSSSACVPEQMKPRRPEKKQNQKLRWPVTSAQPVAPKSAAVVPVMGRHVFSTSVASILEGDHLSDLRETLLRIKGDVEKCISWMDAGRSPPAGLQGGAPKPKPKIPSGPSSAGGLVKKKEQNGLAVSRPKFKTPSDSSSAGGPVKKTQKHGPAGSRPKVFAVGKRGPVFPIVKSSLKPSREDKGKAIAEGPRPAPSKNSKLRWVPVQPTRSDDTHVRTQAAKLGPATGIDPSDGGLASSSSSATSAIVPPRKSLAPPLGIPEVPAMSVEKSERPVFPEAPAMLVVESILPVMSVENFSGPEAGKGSAALIFDAENSASSTEMLGSELVSAQGMSSVAVTTEVLGSELVRAQGLSSDAGKPLPTPPSFPEAPVMLGMESEKQFKSVGVCSELEAGGLSYAIEAAIGSDLALVPEQFAIAKATGVTVEATGGDLIPVLAPFSALKQPSISINPGVMMQSPKMASRNCGGSDLVDLVEQPSPLLCCPAFKARGKNGDQYSDWILQLVMVYSRIMGLSCDGFEGRLLALFKDIIASNGGKSSGSSSRASKKDVEKSQHQRVSELQRLRSIFGTSERQWVEAQVENAKQQAILIALKSQVSSDEAHIHLDLHSLRRKHSELVGELSSLFHKEEKLLSETIPDLCWELAQLQDTYILQGDYDLKVMRQEYYISRQKAFINHLINQLARHQFLKIACQLEKKNMLGAYSLIKVIESELQAYMSATKGRVGRCLALIEAASDVQEQGAVDDKDNFLHGVRDLLSIHSNAQAGFSSYVSAPGIVQQISSLHSDLMTLQSDLENSLPEDRNRCINELCGLIQSLQQLLFASSTTAQPILTPRSLMKELDEMEKINAKLSAAVEEVTLEHWKKNEIVKHHSQEVGHQRRVFVDFFCNPERLRSQVRELTARVRALQVS